MIFIIKWVINSIALGISVMIVKGLRVEGVFSLIAASLVIGLLNTFIRPFLIILTLPINILTLGLFTLIINALLFYLASYIVKGFVVESFFSALAGSIIMSIIGLILNAFVD
ncbi:MAG: phage holin family protein [Desulfurella sp.]|jgi:putative membrane protein|uniref:Putative membrane protein n=1 Tax=Desulfurella multipotens TaxID=79269 RepID=A0A1G6NVA2_9BACT|nr:MULTISPECIES: phage holin family protein [Desulfurella]AHF96602.1 membrane protein [Desulfurella acetivorans A63]PMP69055.1 MAG: phage holin family protein [Desulfurella multipotens]PMP87254.1 MAG: phage holin family protein [Desulfurella sp.]SDC71719.1 putative membrane protein [Desulfurella multipotens]